jgi:hypothetical protein
MACGGCGSVRGMTKPEVANYIQELIDQQKLQAGINDCDGKALPKGAEVVLCDKLADIICALIDKEKICFPTIDEFVYDADKETLSLTFGGKEYTTHIKVKGGDVTGEGKNGVYTIYQDGKEVVKIDTGVQDVKIEDGKLKVSKSGGVEKEFDIPMPTVTPTELTDNGDGTGSVKYGDKTLPVMTKPTTATKAEDGVVTITNSNGTEVTMTIPDCPDTLLVDAFGKVEVGYIHSATCDKSELEKEPKTEEPVIKPYQITLEAVLASDEEGISINDINPSYVVFKLSDFKAPDTTIDSPLTAKLIVRNVGSNSQRVLSEDVYTTTIPTGKTYGSVPYISHSYTELVGKAADYDTSIHTSYELTVENYAGKHIVKESGIPTSYQPLDRL